MIKYSKGYHLFLINILGLNKSNSVLVGNVTDYKKKTACNVQSQAKNCGFFIYTVSKLLRCSVENMKKHYLVKGGSYTFTLHPFTVL